MGNQKDKQNHYFRWIVNNWKIENGDIELESDYIWVNKRLASGLSHYLKIPAEIVLFDSQFSPVWR